MAKKGEGTGFREPRLGISKVYTRTGDAGETGLVGGQRVPKDDLRIEAYGTVDELSATLGLCREEARRNTRTSRLDGALLRVQHQLFNLGSLLATLPADVGPKQPRITAADVDGLEEEIDLLTPSLPPLRSFVLPGGSELNARLHLARTVCRRAERAVVSLRRQGACGDLEVRYLNRLSDALFVWSRWASLELGHPEVLWDPNKA